MRRSVRVAAALPRLAGTSGPVAAIGNLAYLLVASLFGAGVVHLLAYHIPLDVPLGPLWLATAWVWLCACPLLVWLGVIATGGTAAGVLIIREVRRLHYLDAVLRRHLSGAQFRGRYSAPVLPPAAIAVPRSPRRLAGMIGIMLVLQVLLGIVDAVVPQHLHMVMVMNGVPMAMAMTPALPVIPLHLLIAGVLGLVLWRVERRLIQLRARVAHSLGVLAAIDSGNAAGLLPLSMRTPREWHGSILFARPPPCAMRPSLHPELRRTLFLAS